MTAMQIAFAPADTSNRLTAATGTTTMAAEAMQSVFAMAPHDWQEVAISHILALAKDNSCALLLLVRPTGGGKLAVRDTVGVILAGIVLTISPLLSLAADQTDKVGSRASQEFLNYSSTILFGESLWI
jgi:superfamily II DNA helicase RecQ